MQHRDVGRGLQSFLSVQFLEMEEETASGFLGVEGEIISNQPCEVLLNDKKMLNGNLGWVQFSQRGSLLHMTAFSCVSLNLCWGRE